MASALLFDMDGVLVDSEPVHCMNTIQALANQGVTLGEQEYYDFWTRDGKNITHFVKERGLRLDMARYSQDKKTALPDLVRLHLRLMDGVPQQLKALCERYPAALVSSSGKEEIAVILSHAKLTPYFKAVVGYEDVSHPKPAPDGFLLGAQKLGVPTNECVVIEDAWKGIVAAKSAGMKAIAIPNLHTRNNDFSQADRMLASLAELTLSVIEGL